MWRSLLRGQLISLFIAGTGIFATLLTTELGGGDYPLLLALLSYSLLTSYLLRDGVFRRCYAAYKDIVAKYCCGWCGRYSYGRVGVRVADTIAGKGKLINRDDVSSSNHIENNCAESQDNDISLRHCGSDHNKEIYYLLYLLVAVIDVEANYMIIQAYNYTSITSIMLLDCFTIPCAMLLSHVFLRCRYTTMHFGGITCCLLGLALIVYGDLNGVGSTGALSPTHVLYGDLLCLCGAALYGCSNVLQEVIVKYHDRSEFMGCLGAFGFIIATTQFCILELSSLQQAWPLSGAAYVYIAGFVSCLFMMYTNTSLFLQDGDSILFNLGLLTSDVYAVVFSYFFYGSLVHWQYFVAFALVALGLSMYHSERKPMGDESPLSLREDLASIMAEEDELMDKDSAYSPMANV